MRLGVRGRRFESCHPDQFPHFVRSLVALTFSTTRARDLPVHTVEDSQRESLVSIDIQPTEQLTALRQGEIFRKTERTHGISWPRSLRRLIWNRSSLQLSTTRTQNPMRPNQSLRLRAAHFVFVNSGESNYRRSECKLALDPVPCHYSAPERECNCPR